MVPFILLYAVPTVLVLYGFRKYRESKWGKCTNTLRLDGKIVIITGANSGIGYETAKDLASRGANVILACRNQQLSINAIKNMEKELNMNLKLDFIHLDLASFNSVRSFAKEVELKYEKVDILINNAGVSFPKTKKILINNKYEIHFCINYLSHFLLTDLLLDHLQKSNNGRIINVASLLHQKGVLHLEDIHFENTPIVNPYADSKLAMMYFGQELANRTKGVNVYTLCPGWVYTNLFRHTMKNILHMILVLPIAFLFMRNRKMGAQTSIYCATEPSLDNETGLFYKDCKQFKSKHEFNKENGKKLWEISKKLVTDFSF